MKVSIFHNPRCSKSRNTLALLKENGITPEIIDYLNEVPTKDALQSVLQKLDMSAEALIRKGEDIYKSTFKNKTLTEEEWLEAMIQHPKLIERPIVIRGDKAVIGRPPENCLSLLS